MKTTIIAIALLLLAGCDSGKWVDGVAMDCTNGKPAPILKTKSDMAEFARSMCGHVGKTWANEWRCNGDALQVKCS